MLMLMKDVRLKKPTNRTLLHVLVVTPLHLNSLEHLLHVEWSRLLLTWTNVVKFFLNQGKRSAIIHFSHLHWSLRLFLCSLSDQCIPLMHQIVALSIKFLLSLQRGSQGLFCFFQPNDGVLCPQQHLFELYIEKSS